MLRLQIFETLFNSDGDIMHPLRRAWGREQNHYSVELERKEKFSLASRLRQAFEFLVQNVLDATFVKKTQDKIEVGAETSQSDMLQRASSRD